MSSQSCPSRGPVCQCGLQAIALFQHRAPASQQDECRLGSQAGGNPRSLLWLCAPADLQPGFAVIPTSCCRSLISWKKTQNPNPKLLWLKFPAARWWEGWQQVGDWEGWERSQFPCWGWKQRKGCLFLLGVSADPPVLFPCRGDGLGLRH